MTPTRMVSICAGLLIFSALFITLTNAQNDLVYRTRSTIKQMQKADDLSEPRFQSALSDPDGNLAQQQVQFSRAWKTIRSFTMESAELGQRGRRELADGRRLPYGEVLVHGKLAGEPRILHVEWVNSNGKWCFHDFRDE